MLPQLRYRDDWRTLGFMVALTILYAVQWVGVLRWFPLLPATCFLAFVACIIKHNHMHCRTFSSRGWNTFFNLWLSLVTGQPATGIITAHNERHHMHSNEDGDFVRCSLVRSRWNILNFLLFAPRSVLTMFREKPSDLARWRKRSPVLFRAAIVERVFVYVAFAALLILDWKATLVYIGIPCFFGQWALVSINLLQHQDCDHDSEFDHSRNITGSVANWIFFNNGLHTAHHLRPGLHWSRLRAFHEEVVAPRISEELNERSFILAVWRRLKAKPVNVK